MRKILLCLVMATACAQEGPHGPDGEPALPDTSPTGGDAPELDDIGAFRAQSAEPPSTSVCDRLPQDDSACAHACDPDALAASIPEGTCTMFDCPLSDGTVYRTGGCNIP